MPTLLLLLVIGYIVRGWTRSMARKHAVDESSTPESLFLPIFLAMLLRVSAFVVALCGLAMWGLLTNEKLKPGDAGAVFGGLGVLCLLVVSEIAIVTRRSIRRRRHVIETCASSSEEVNAAGSPSAPAIVRSIPHESSSTRLRWIVTFCAVIAAVACGVVLMVKLNHTKPESSKSPANSPNQVPESSAKKDNVAFEWQLPVKLGDTLEKVKVTLGPDYINETLGSPDETESLLTWSKKGLSLLFRKGTVNTIDVSTGRGLRSAMSVAYEGGVFSGLTTKDSIDVLVQKLGTPTDISTVGENAMGETVKSYSWVKPPYYVSTHTANGQWAAELSIDNNIQEHLKRDREWKLAKQRIDQKAAREKQLVLLPGNDLTPKDIFQRYSHRVVEVEAINSKHKVAATGTGFLWRSDELLTNFHIVAQAHIAQMKRNERIAFSKWFRFSEPQDWIVLRFITEVRLPPVAIAPGLPEVGESVTVIGNPDGLTNSLSTGVVAGLRRLDGNVWIQITAPISHGSSGSPVFDSKGRLIGIATMMLIDGQNLNFATPIGQIEKALAKRIADEELWEEMPLKSLRKDREYNSRFVGFVTEPHKETEISQFGKTYLEKYSDPIDQKEVLSTMATAYSTSKLCLKAIEVNKKIMELFGEDYSGWQGIGEELENLGRHDEAQRAYRTAVKLGLREFETEKTLRDTETTASPAEAEFIAKKSNPKLSAKAAMIGNTLVDLDFPSQEEGVKWFAASWVLDAVWAKGLVPTWYDGKKANRQPELLGGPVFNAQLYYETLRKKWLTKNERELFSLLRSFGFRQDSQDKMASAGIDKYNQLWWEQNILSSLDRDGRLKVQAVLQQRKSLLEQ